MIQDSRFKIQDRRGFTLIELLVTVSITALLSAFVITYTSGGRVQTTLYVEQAKIIQVIARAKSIAISTYDTSAPPCGYGVHFDPSAGSYDVFEYHDSNCGSIGFIDSTDVAHYTSLSHYVLPQTIALTDGDSAISDVFFIPPDPQTRIWSGGVILQSGAGRVYLASKDGPWTSSVQVSVAGQVSQ